MVTVLPQQESKKVKTTLRFRICVICRRKTHRSELLRLTFDYKNCVVFLNTGSPQHRKICGRSAYLCRKISCVDQAMKSGKLKFALEGRKPKNSVSRRQVAWPLESQLIHTLRISSTESLETCQNTPIEEESC